MYLVTYQLSSVAWHLSAVIRHPPPVSYQMSPIICPLSRVLCPLSCVPCPLSLVPCPVSRVLCPLARVSCLVSLVQCPCPHPLSLYFVPCLVTFHLLSVTSPLFTVIYHLTPIICLFAVTYPLSVCQLSPVTFYLSPFTCNLSLSPVTCQL